MAGVSNITNYNETNITKSMIDPLHRLISESVYFGIMGYLFVVITIYEARKFFHLQKPKQPKLRNRRNIVVYSILMRGGTYIATLVTMMLRVVALLRTLGVQLSGLSCDFSVRCKPVFWSVSMFLVYLVLWCRQRTMYNNPTLKQNTNKCMRFFSLAAAIIFVPLHITYSIFMILSQKGELREGVCVEVPLLQKSQIAIMSTIAMTLVCTQSMLMFLLGWPLLSYIRNSTINTSKKLVPMLQRTFILTVICAVSDVFGPVGIILVDDVQSFKFYYFGASLIVDVICINLNFKSWKERLLPVNITISNPTSDANGNEVSKNTTTRNLSSMASQKTSVGYINTAMMTINEEVC